TPSNTEAEIEDAWVALPRTSGATSTHYEWKVYRTLIHGGINHGRQVVRFRDSHRQAHENEIIEPEIEAMNRLKRREPITYFHQRNGVAELFYKLGWRGGEPLT